MAAARSLPFSLLDALATLGSASSLDAAAAALSDLAVEVDRLEPTEMSALSVSARESGALERICALLRVPAASQHALAILANLTTADVNPRGAQDAKEVMLRCDGMRHVVSHLFSEYVQTAALACAVCQNVCANDADVVSALQQGGGWLVCVS